MRVQDQSPPDKPESQQNEAEARKDQAAKAPPADDAAKATPADLAELLKAAEARANENWERALRATAEQDNIRKRAEREVDAARKFALERFAQDLLQVRDSLELGLKAAREAAAEAKHLEGMELTLKMLIEAMTRHGIEVIDPAGAPFDPAQHEAMSAVPTADAAPNSVLEVMQKGYRLHERVLRPAMVVVAKAPSEPPPGDAGPDQAA